MNTKRDLRKKMKRVRSEIVNREQQETTINQNLFKLLQEKYPGTTVLSFLSLGTEIDLTEFHNSWLKEGGKLGFPKVKDWNSGAMDFYPWKLGDKLIANEKGILEPKEYEPISKSADIILIPCLAADIKGRRLGYGGGFYDRFLIRWSGKLKLCPIFNEQLIEDVPTSNHDTPVDALFTPHGLTQI